MALDDALGQTARDESRTQAVGVFGGSFDPIHSAHLMVAHEVAHRLVLDSVLFVPAQVSPLKQASDAMFTGEERARLVEIAVADNPCFALSTVDLDRQPPSFTVDTLALLAQALGPRTRLHFVMGLDSLATFHLWREPQTILELARLAIVTRPGSRVDWEQLEQRLPGIRERSDLIETLDIGISSTDIRGRIRERLPYRYMMPPGVYDAIQDIVAGKKGQA